MAGTTQFIWGRCCCHPLIGQFARKGGTWGNFPLHLQRASSSSNLLWSFPNTREQIWEMVGKLGFTQPAVVNILSHPIHLANKRFTEAAIPCG